MKEILNGRDFLKMSRPERDAHLAKLDGKGAAAQRAQARAEQIMVAVPKLKAKLEANPNHAKAKGWRRRLAEYEVSLRNLAEHGVEKIVDGPMAVKVNVPADFFDLKGS